MSPPTRPFLTCPDDAPHLPNANRFDQAARRYLRRRACPACHCRWIDYLTVLELSSGALFGLAVCRKGHRYVVIREKALTYRLVEEEPAFEGEDEALAEPFVGRA